MKRLTFALLVLAFCTACQTSPASRAHPELRAKLQAVTIVDGISRAEADIIGRSYFARHVGCGAFLGVHDVGGHWIVDAKFGYGGEPVHGFTIDKRTGAVVSPIGPNYSNPLKILP